MSTLLKVATIAITHLAMDLGLKNTKQATFRLYKRTTTHLWQPSKSTKKKTHGRTPEKKTMAAILLTPMAASCFSESAEKDSKASFSNDEFILQIWKL